MMVKARWSVLPLFLLSLCVAPSTQQRTELDLVFVVDGADSVGPNDFDTIKTSILNYVLPQMNNGALQVGFVLYSTNLNNIVNLTPDPNVFRSRINGLNFVGGATTNTNVGLQWGLSVLMSQTTRPGVPQVMIVIVSNDSLLPSDTQSVGNFVRQMAVETYAIGVGSVSTTELTRIAGDASRIFTTTSYARLSQIDLQLNSGPVQSTVPATTTTRSPVPTTTTTRRPVPTTTTTRRPVPTTTTRRPVPTTTTTRRPVPTTTTTRRPVPTTTTTRRPVPTTTTTTRRPVPTTTTTRRPVLTTTTRRPVRTTTTRRPVFTTTTKPRTRPTGVPTRPPVTTPTRPVITTTRTTTPRITTTTRKAPITAYVEPYVDVGLCDGSRIVAGVGYMGHPHAADKYIQCYFPKDGQALAVIRECPFGTLYNAKHRLCDPFHRINIVNDPCRKKEVKSHPHEGNCRTFYNCEADRSVPRCCPPGYLYNALAQACTPCQACKDPCPAMCDVERLTCNKYPVFDDPTVFRKWSRDGYVLANCPSGTRFDLTACECREYTVPAVCIAVIEVPFQDFSSRSDVVKFENVQQSGFSGVFNGLQSRVSVNTTQGNPFKSPLVIRLTYREAEELKESKALISSRRCSAGGIFLVSLDEGQIKVELSSYGRTPIIFRLPTTGFKTNDVKDVLLVHDGDYIIATVKSGGLIYTQRAEVAVLPYLHCGLHFGTSEWMEEGFSGTISRVQLLRCIPADY